MGSIEVNVHSPIGYQSYWGTGAGDYGNSRYCTVYVEVEQMLVPTVHGGYRSVLGGNYQGYPMGVHTLCPGSVPYTP